MLLQAGGALFRPLIRSLAAALLLPSKLCVGVSFSCWGFQRLWASLSDGGEAKWSHRSHESGLTDHESQWTGRVWRAKGEDVGAGSRSGERRERREGLRQRAGGG